MVLKADLPHILAVDDDDRIRRLLAQYLTKNDYMVVTAENAAEAREILKRYDFDLCVLDIMMPGESGLDLSRYISTSYDLPVLLLTAMGEGADRIQGLESGADDYLVKPFEPKELLLRIQSILRRTYKDAPTVFKANDVIYLDGYHYHPDQKTIKCLNTDAEIFLTDGEVSLLNILAQKPNIPIRREMLARHLKMETNDRAIDVQITRLRKKIEKDPSRPKVIMTQRGKGYFLKVLDK